MRSGWQLITLIALLANFQVALMTWTSAEGSASVAASHPYAC